MNPTRLVLVSLLLASPALNGCSRPPDATAPAPTAATDPQPAAPAPATKSREDARACDLVTSSQMSAILDSPVVGTPNDRSNGKTECVYQTDKPITGTVPYVDLTVEWGGGEAAMAAMGAMGRVEPGITNPYAGIGDQAGVVGTSLWIRSGEDLITITFSGVDNASVKAKRIYDTLKAKM